MSTDNVWVSRAGVEAVESAFRAARDEIRDLAHAATGDERRPVREAYIAACFVLDRHRDRALIEVGLPTAGGPARPEFADAPAQEYPLVGPPDWPLVNRSAVRGGVHRSSP